MNKFNKVLSTVGGLCLALILHQIFINITYDSFANTYPNATTTLINYSSLNLYDFINDNNNLNTNNLNIYGYLILPNSCNAENKCPLMIFSHGSNGWRNHHEKYIRRLIQEEIGVFKLFPFDSRGVKNTIGNQTQVTQQMIISDAYSVLPTLSTYSSIDMDKLGIMGTSLGGGAALYSAWNPEFMKSIHNSTFDFKLHVALYPPCFIFPEINVWTNHTVIIMIGTADNWTRAEPCTELMSMIYSGENYIKTNKHLRLYYQEHHSFDDINYMSELNGTLDFINCRFTIDKQGRMIYNNNGSIIHLNNVNNRYKALQQCVIKQNHYTGYNSKIINKHAMEEFMIILFSALKPEKLYI
jgi:dienelactone hydrolase